MGHRLDTKSASALEQPFSNQLLSRQELLGRPTAEGCRSVRGCLMMQRPLAVPSPSVYLRGLFAAVVCSLTLLSGCDQISRPGPGLEAITKRAGDLAGFTLIDDHSNTVLVTGDVKAPGRFSLLEGPLTIIDAINHAGGSARPPYQTDVVLRRGRTVRRMGLSSIQGGRNIPLERGDEIVVESNFKVFNALGAVARTGQIDFPK